jgi:hypothetical protein
LKKRDSIKLLILIPSLAFLLWWGWSGNFAFNRPALFTLYDQESFYDLEMGRTSMGFARREIRTDPQSQRSTLSEASVLNLTFAGQPVRIKTISETTFDQEGRLISASFSLPFGSLSGQATAVVEGQAIKCQLKIGETIHEAQAPMPPTGPILVSGLVPWLARQHNIPIGRPIGLSLLDPVSMAFNPAELIVEDDTQMSDELQVFKLTLRFMGSENIEWVDSQGQLVRQFNPALEIGLARINAAQSETARALLDQALAEESPIPEGPLGAMIGQFLANDGLGSLSKAISGGGQANHWSLVAPQTPPATAGTDQPAGAVSTDAAAPQEPGASAASAQGTGTGSAHGLAPGQAQAAGQ